MRTVNYNFIGDTTGTHYDGFLAQEFQQVIPHGVVTNPDGYLAVNESSMLPYIVGAIKELNLNINQIENFEFNTDGTDERTDYDIQAYYAELNLAEFNLAKFAGIKIEDIENMNIDNYLTIVNSLIISNKPTNNKPSIDVE